MGCFHPSRIDTDKIIDYDFTFCGIPEIDDVFFDLRECMSTIEKNRSGIEDNQESLIYRTHAITLRDPSFKEAIKIMFWCISANHDGNIRECMPSVSKKAPYLDMTITNFEVSPLWDRFRHYLKTAGDAPNEVHKQLINLHSLLERVEGLSNGGLKTALEDSHPQQKLKVTAETMQNINKVRKQMPKIQRVKDVVDQTKAEVEEMTGYLHGLIENADEVGAKAHEVQKYAVDVICHTYHPGPFKSKEEIEIIKKKISNY